MPAVIGTPESILPRRSLASSKNVNQGVIAVMPYVGNDTAAYFCWQHKDQAENLVDGTAQILNLQQRSSIDTLMEKLQVSDHQGPRTPTRSKKASVNKTPQSASASAPDYLLSTPGNPSESNPVVAPLPTSGTTRRKRRRQQIHVSFFCCMKSPHSDSLPPARPRPVVEATSQTRPVPYRVSDSRQFSYPHQGSPITNPDSLENHLSYIPPVLTSNTRAALMMELSKPFTAADHEPGYIYIFWLTPKDVPKDVAQLASSLLQPPDRASIVKNNKRRTSDVLQQFNNDGSGSSGTSRTIMLKIGRASNVHRRMVQWSQQCGHHITLLRYYPNHKSSSPLPSPHTSPSSSSRNTLARDTSPSPAQKSPLVARVERLIHLELADKRVRRDCEGCGRQHREWFEVDATRKGIREVDDIVRRWINWAGQQKSPASTVTDR